MAPALLVSFVLIQAGCERSSSLVRKGDTSVAGTQGHAIPDWFLEATEAVSLDFVHNPGAGTTAFMPECIGSGVALFDYDLDGRLDLYLIQNAGRDSGAVNRLYHQEADGRFRDVSAGSGLDIAGRGMGVAIGDVNNDGKLDVFVTEYGRIRLFLSAGSGKFTDISDAAGISSPLWATSASFVDYDRDGWLDLVIADYVNYDPSRWCADPAGRREYCGPDAFPGTVARLYRNLGQAAASGASGARFEDATFKAGLISAPGPGLGVVCFDFNRDRWPDVLVANDGAPNHLWINHRDGTFGEEGTQRGISLNSMGHTEANMGIAAGDVDSDGFLDIFVTHLTDETPTLWKQRQPGFFEDATIASGLGNPRWRGTGFGTVMADFDNDGAIDIAAVNGKVRRGTTSDGHVRIDPELSAFWMQYAERGQLFRNVGGGRFEDISEGNDAFCGTAAVSRGLACGDLDNDGFLDLVVSSIGGRARVFRNTARGGGHWLRLRVIDPALHRDAYGAEASVVAGARKFARWINPGSSYLSSHDARAHFGLGSADQVDRIEVVWPDGIEESFPGGAVDREITLRKGEGKRSNP